MCQVPQLWHLSLFKHFSLRANKTFTTLGQDAVFKIESKFKPLPVILTLARYYFLYWKLWGAQIN